MKLGNRLPRLAKDGDAFSFNADHVRILFVIDAKDAPGERPSFPLTFKPR